MVFSGPAADKQKVANFFARFTFGDQFYNLAFPGR
jgi:hypothetical protein